MSFVLVPVLDLGTGSNALLICIGKYYNNRSRVISDDSELCYYILLIML